MIAGFRLKKALHEHEAPRESRDFLDIPHEAPYFAP